MITLTDVKRNPKVQSYIRGTDESLEAIGYTEHGKRHAELVSSIAHNILIKLGRPEEVAELAAIAGYIHDIGNVVNRNNHAISGALIAKELLTEMGAPIEDVIKIISAIGNHHEEHSDPVNEIAAAVIIADKADVHRSRVRNPNTTSFDIHDRVNYAVTKSFAEVDALKKTITLELKIDTKISQPMEYFEIFMDRMIASRRAAEFLGCRFGLVINGNQML